VILVDVNLLIYAVDSDSPQHSRARRWLEQTLSGDTPVGLPWAVVLAFLRVTTRAGILRAQLSLERAIELVDEWLAQPYVTLVVPGDAHWSILKNLVLEAGSAGNLTTDAHLAALAIENGSAIATADHDFRRFASLKVVNPLVEPR
jgi:toxin-antitoxin system PIN domain toxin